jgi:hypothetical protein
MVNITGSRDLYSFGLVWFGLVWFGLVWFGLVDNGSPIGWFGLVWLLKGTRLRLCGGGWLVVLAMSLGWLILQVVDWLVWFGLVWFGC